MQMAHLAKRMYPKLQSGRAVYQLKMVLVAASVGVVLGGVMVAVIYLQSRIGR